MKVKLEHLRPSQLTIDDSYQRDINPAYVQKLVAEWDDDKLGVLFGNRRNGIVALTEGQHRRAALIALDKDEPVPVVVTDGATLAYEAGQFLSANDKKDVDYAFKHRAKLATKDRQALRIQRTLEQYGLTLDPKMEGVRIRGASTVYQVERKCRIEGLDVVLNTLLCAFGPYSASFSAHLLLGVGIVTTSNGAPIEFDRLVKVLQRKDTDQWKIEARKPENGASNENLGVCMARALRRAYNSGIAGIRRI